MRNLKFQKKNFKAKTKTFVFLFFFFFFFLIFLKNIYILRLYKSNFRWPNYIVPVHCIKSTSVSSFDNNDIGESRTLTHNHNPLIGIITFKVHHITLTSPKNTLITILKAFLLFLLFMLFAYFFF